MPQLNLEELTRLVKSHVGGGGFSPCAFVDGLGSLKIINKDCSELHNPITGTNLELIRDTHTNEVVGVIIHDWHRYKKGRL